MKWVKIEDGCEIPKRYETVAVVTRNASHWSRVIYLGDDRFVHVDYPLPVIPTHWARVELPEE